MGARHRAVGSGAAADDPRRAGARPDRRIRPDLSQSPEDVLSHATRHLPIVILAIFGLSIAACGPSTPSASPVTAAPSSTPSAAAAVTASPAAPTVTVTPTVTPS